MAKMSKVTKCITHNKRLLVIFRSIAFLTKSHVVDDKTKYWHGVSVNSPMHKRELYWLSVFHIILYYEKVSWDGSQMVDLLWCVCEPVAKLNQFSKFLGKDWLKHLKEIR